MTDLSIIEDVTDRLPALVDRAANTLAGARSSAEVLEAKFEASIAYDAAKRAARMPGVKQAHDDILSRVYRAQAAALLIESKAKARLADEYDAAQERGEVRRNGERGKALEDDKGFFQGKRTAADIGLRYDEIHEARKFRDAERAQPGVSERVTSEAIGAGLEPSRAQLRRAIDAVLKEGSESTPRSGNPLKEKDPHSAAAIFLAGRCNDLINADTAFLAHLDPDSLFATNLKKKIPQAIAALESMKETLDDR